MLKINVKDSNKEHVKIKSEDTKKENVKVDTPRVTRSGRVIKAPAKFKDY